MTLTDFEFKENNTVLVLTFKKEVVSAREAWHISQTSLHHEFGIYEYLRKTRFSEPRLAYDLIKEVAVHGFTSSESSSVLCQIKITFDCSKVYQVDTLLSREMLDENNGVLMHATHRVLGYFDKSTYPSIGVSFYFSKMRKSSPMIERALRKPPDLIL